MCITTERQSNICGHVASHTDVCIAKRNLGVLNVLWPKCVPTRHRKNYYEICHDCQQFWQKHGIDEQEATQRTRAYRVENNYYGPMSPHSLSGGEPYIMRDINLDSGNDRRSAAAPVRQGTSLFDGLASDLENWFDSEGGTIDKEGLPKGHEKDLTSWLVGQAMGDASSSSGESSPSSSRLTVWPRVPGEQSEDARNKGKNKGKKREKTGSKHGDVPDDPNSLPHPDTFEVEGLSPGSPHGPLPNPNEFELEALEGQPGPNTDYDDLYGASPPRPKSKSGSSLHEELSGKRKSSEEESARQGESSRPSAKRRLNPMRLDEPNPPPDLNKPLPPSKWKVKSPPDLDKPLPPLPKCDTAEIYRW